MAAVNEVFANMFGTTLLSKDGEVTTAEALSGKKAIGVYFSAHWCPPCRGFTPKLAEFYLKDLKAKGLEVIFVSSDKNEAAFKEYFAEQPWLALPYGRRDLHKKLNKMFKVRGIPSFVILDGETGAKITDEGRKAVMEDPCGAEFPWRPQPPKPFTEIFGAKFLKNAAGEEVDRAALEGKVVGIYFSAHWCPPCRSFTPKLVEWYKKVQAKGHPFEIVFASSDREEAGFKDYFGEMPWLALPHGDERKGKWSEHFEIQGIPTFVILDKDLSTITKDGREAVMEDPEGEGFPWHPKPPAPIGDLAKPRGIEESPSIVIFMENVEKDAQDRILSELEPLATRYRDAAWDKQEEPELRFFAARTSEQPVPQVRKMTAQELEPKAATAVLLDLDDEGAYYTLEGEVTAANVEKFIADFKGETLTRKQVVQG